MLKIAKILRFLLFLIISLLILVPTAAYLVMTSDWGQQKLREIGERELSAYLGTEVAIDRLLYSPFNNITLEGVRINDDNDSIALKAGVIDAGFEFWDFILKNRIIIDYATIDTLDVNLYRTEKDSPLNIANIIEKVSRKDPDKPETIFSLRLNRLEVHNSSVSYNILSEKNTPGKFNVAHVNLSNLDIEAFLPEISNDLYHVILDRLSFAEQNGFTLEKLKGEFNISPSELSVSKLEIRLPKTFVAVGDIDMGISGFDDIKNYGVSKPLKLDIKDGSHFYLPDFKTFEPKLADLSYDIDLCLKAFGTIDDMHLELEASEASSLASVQLTGGLRRLESIDDIVFNDVKFDIFARQSLISRISQFGSARQAEMSRILDNLNVAHATGNIDGTIHDARFDVEMSSAIAVLEASGTFRHPANSQQYAVDVDCAIDSLRLGTILGNPEFNQLAGNFSVNGNLNSGKFTGEGNGEVRKFDYRGHRYTGINFSGAYDGSDIDADISITDRYANLDVSLLGSIVGNRYQGEINADIRNLNTDSLNLPGILPALSVKGDILASGDFVDIDCFKCILSVDNLDITKTDGKRLYLNSLDVNADNIGEIATIFIESDYLDGFIHGRLAPKTFVNSFTRMVSTIVPALTLDVSSPALSMNSDVNNFDFDISLRHPNELCEFFSLPISILENVDISGTIDDINNTLHANVSVPWLPYGNNLVENSAVSLDIDKGNGRIYATTHIPTKKGDLDVFACITGSNDLLKTYINWEIDREIPIRGDINFNTLLYRSRGMLAAKVDFDPGEILFGDDNWKINKSTVTYDNGMLYVNNLVLNTLTQQIGINGVGGANPENELIISLNNIDLVKIFETLNIDNAYIGGYATGNVYARGVLGKDPVIEAKGLQIRDIGYNYCTIGDAVANLSLIDGAKMFRFDADIKTTRGTDSSLNGYIYIPNEELELNINAKEVKVGFLQPFMEAFCSEIDGYASGHAQLKGTFSDLDLTGDVFADSLRIKIEFTNTYYSASDSIHIRPGCIQLDDIVMYDDYGNTALLNGTVKHKYFHDATFDINVTNARNFLCYDVTEKLNPDWYGRIFGNGNLSVTGRPGFVDIKAVMSTAANSVFTFVLSDSKDAEEYSFITFRDKTPRKSPDPILDVDPTPVSVRQYKAKSTEESSDSPTAYKMDLNIDITPQAQMILVMDPAGGDRIRAFGEGHMRMVYKSVDNSLSLRGRYVLDRGNYNFTLQDIIIKDFIIKKGSSISFDGDPYAATLDIDAYYPVNANLTDLDESFAHDKELNRTNVPVRAILQVSGNMLQPDIAFDLEFPTLTEDINRKVHSIVSTEDMMNRQIIYLLAFNRFYTPEYMASTTKGNELFSVASSTIASQISNMLGKLSENWSIAPNLRSDRGDFSDLEVDVQLSTSLLNNRLIVNGNLGYRDKPMNSNNQFVGDFDVEALLNRSGTWRFKAYNRYNDQNYYLRTAQTTQGLGLVYRMDFDDIFSFLKKKDKEKTDTITKSPILNTPADTLIIRERSIIENKSINPDSI